MLMRIQLAILALSVVSCSSLYAKEQKRRHRLAHVHGEAQMSIAVDGQQMEVLFNTPADGVFGFEHEPGNDQEKKIVADGQEKLRQGILQIINLPKELNCKASVKEMNIELAQNRRSQRDERMGLPATPKGHGDIKVLYEIKCERSLAKAEVKIDMASYFSRITKTRVVVLSETGQTAKTVTTKPVKFTL